MTPDDFDFLNGLEERLTRFRAEYQLVLAELVLPTWNGNHHGLSEVLSGLVGRAFSYVDVLASIWRGEVNEGKQTPRMVAFSVSLLGYGHEEANVAVQIWRHKLLHTTLPRLLVTSGATEYCWLLHWGEPHLDRSHHMNLTVSGDRKVLGLGLQFLIEDLLAAVRSLKSSVAADAALQKNVMKARPKIQTGRYRP